MSMWTFSAGDYSGTFVTAFCHGFGPLLLQECFSAAGVTGSWIAKKKPVERGLTMCNMDNCGFRGGIMLKVAGRSQSPC